MTVNPEETGNGTGIEVRAVETAEADDAGRTVVSYHFPVEIQVVGAVGGEVVDDVARQVLDQLDRELSSRL